MALELISTAFQEGAIIPKQYTAGQTEFSPKWRYGFADDAVVRDGREITGPIRIEGSQKHWTDKGTR